MSSTYYHTCPYCGANLDPGESCDCQKETDYSSTVTEKSKPSTISKSKENKDGRNQELPVCT